MTSTQAFPRPLALVTGAAHRLGRELALSLASMGYDIALHYHRSLSQAEHTASEIVALGVNAVPLQADLTDLSQIEHMFAELCSPLAVLINSAAIMPQADLLTMPSTTWDETFDINLRAPWLCSRYAARLMPQGTGCIINITDAGAGRTWNSYAAYSISKSALETLTRLLARTLAPHIRVNGIAPGLVFPSPQLTASEWNRLVDRLPLQQPAKTEDITHALRYLLTNPHVTGQILVVDGGYQLL